MSQTRDLKLKLTVVADASGASSVLSNLGAQAKQAQQAAYGVPAAAGGGFPSSMLPGAGVSRVSAFERPIPVIIVGPKQIIDGGMGRYAPGGGVGGGPPGAGVPPAGPGSGYGPMAARGAAAFGVGMAAIDFMRTHSRYAADSYMTSEQRNRAVLRDGVPFGRQILGAIDDLTGRAGRMQDVVVQGEQLGTIASRDISRNAFEWGLRPERARADSMAGQLGSARPYLEPTINRTTASGERAFREMQRLIPLEREEIKLQREAAAATAARAQAENSLAEQQGKLNQHRKEEAELKQRRDAGGSGPEYARVVTDLERTQARIEQMEKVREQTAQQINPLRAQEAIAIRAATGAGIARTRETAGILEERAATASGTATRLGGMHGVDRMFGIQALKLVQENAGNLSSLPPEIIAQAQAIAPQTVQKLLEQHGAGTAEFGELQRLAPADAAGDPEGLRRRAAGLRNQAVGAELAADAQVAQAVAAALKDMANRVVDAMNKARDEAVQIIDTRVRVGKSTQ